MIKGAKSCRDQILQHGISGCSYPPHRGLWASLLPGASVSELFSFSDQKQQQIKTNRNDKTPRLARCRNYSQPQTLGSSRSPSLSGWSFPAISLAITQPTQQNQSVLNFSWDLRDLLMNLQRGEKLTVLSYAWCC